MDCYEKVLGLGDGRDGGREEGKKGKANLCPVLIILNFLRPRQWKNQASAGGADGSAGIFLDGQALSEEL